MLDYSVSQKDQMCITAMGYEALYLVGIEGDKPTDPIKVGSSAMDPGKRLQNFQISNWRRVFFWDVMFVQSREDFLEEKLQHNYRRIRLQVYRDDSMTASAIEKSVHQYLKKQGNHVRGEWFNGGVSYLQDALWNEIGKSATPNATYKEMKKRVKLRREELDIRG